MSDKWQQINLKLEAELAQALRDVKLGHDESLSEVVIRLLWKAVRQNAAARGVPIIRGNERGTGRRAFGTGGRGKAAAPAGRAAPGAAPKGKRFAPRAAGAWDAAEGKRGPEGAPTLARARRKFTGKPGKAFRPQPVEASGEPRKRAFRPSADGPRSFRPSGEGAAESRPKRPRKAKVTRPSRG
jgi:hypothetical protein